MFGSTAVHRMSLSVVSKRDNLEVHLPTFTLRVTTSTEVGSSHHSLHPLLQEAVAPYKAVLTHGMILDDEIRER